MTQKEFAEFMGVTQGMVSKWESREYNFTIKSLNEICEKLGLDCSVEVKRVNDRSGYIHESWQKEFHKKRKAYGVDSWTVLEGAIA